MCIEFFFFFWETPPESVFRAGQAKARSAGDGPPGKPTTQGGFCVQTRGGGALGPVDCTDSISPTTAIQSLALREDANGRSAHALARSAELGACALGSTQARPVEVTVNCKYFAGAYPADVFFAKSYRSTPVRRVERRLIAQGAVPRRRDHFRQLSQFAQAVWGLWCDVP